LPDGVAQHYTCSPWGCALRQASALVRKGERASP